MNHHRRKKSKAKEDKELKVIRAVYSQSLDLSLAMEQALKHDFKGVPEHEELIKDFLTDLHQIKAVVREHQEIIEDAIINHCGGRYGKIKEVG